MTWFAPLSDTTGVSSGGDGDGVFIGPTVQLSVTFAGILLTGTATIVDIYGTVVSTSADAVLLGANSSNAGHRIDIHEGALVRGFGVSGLSLDGYGSQVTNAGDVYGASYGIFLDASNVAGSSSIINSGKIVGGNFALAHDGSEVLTVVNSGSSRGRLHSSRWAPASTRSPTPEG